jgi:hypothetical protein
MPRLSSDEVVHEARVVLGLSMDPPRQSRWSVFLRGILAIPLFFVAFFIGVAAGFMSFVGWFAAVFTGRVPDGIQEFLVGALRMYTNVLAYAYFLTARWPGINFSPKPSQQVTVDADHVKLRRAAVFFRLILAYPANIVNGLLSLGAVPFLVVMWLWGIVAGREPRALHQALALILRYQIRFEAYSTLVSPTQPFRGLFGDGVVSSSTTAATAPPETPLSVVSTSSLAVDPAPATIAGPAASSPLPTRWFVSKMARAVVIVSLLLGVPVYIGVAFAERPLITKIQNAVARAFLTPSHTTTVNAMAAFENSVRNCSASAYVGCAARAATTASSQLSLALAPVTNMNLFPPDARYDATQYVYFLRQLQADVIDVQFSTSATLSMKEVNEIPKVLSNFERSYNTLSAELSH